MAEQNESDKTSFDELSDTLNRIFEQVESAVDAGLYEAKLGGIEGTRQRLSELDIENAVTKVKELVDMAIYETNAQPFIDDARALMTNLWQRVESGEIEEDVRTEMANMLRTLQEELDKHFPQEDKQYPMS